MNNSALFLKKIKSKLSNMICKLHASAWGRWELSLQHLSRKGVTRKKRQTKIIVSLTSYEPRIPFLGLPLRSLLKQSMKPDLVVVWLACDLSFVPDDIKKLEKFGVDFRRAPYDAKSHKKYLFSMKEFPEDYIITVDDDIVYDRHLISSLWKTHKKYPNAIVARRVHGIVFKLDGTPAKYASWEYELKKVIVPSFRLCATGCAGMLFPPHALPSVACDFELSRKIAPKADDLWLKYMSLLKGTKVVWAKNNVFPLHEVHESQIVQLSVTNVLGSGNDRAISQLENKYHDAVRLATSGCFYPKRSDILISIVIPVYNAEKTIERCIQSFAEDYSEDCELIIINDGSSDSSPEVIRKATQKLPNVLIVDKENGGSNSAYNLGFALAQGQYILSLDDDDELSPETLNFLRDDLQLNPDIVQFKVRDISIDGSITERATKFTPLQNLDACTDIFTLLDGQIRTHSGKAIRQALIKDIVFSGNPHGADTRFFLKVLSRAKSLSIDPRAIWVHHMSETSQSNRPHNAAFHESWMFNLKEDLDFFRRSPIHKGRLFSGLEIYFSHYCFYCQQSYLEETFNPLKARKYGKIIWRYRRLFPSHLYYEMFKRMLFPKTIARNNSIV